MADDPYAQYADPYAQYAAPPAAKTPAAAQPEPWSFAGFVKNLPSLIGRPIANAVSALPLMAMDAGVQARNFIEHPHVPSLQDFNPFSAQGRSAGEYTLPSDMYRQSLNSVTNAPTTTGGRLGELANSVVAGGLLPNASAAQGAPSNFVSPTIAARQQALAIAQRQNLIAPASQANPTFMNRLLEGIGGKLKLNQEMMQANQPQFTRIAAQELGQNPEAPLTQGSLASVRQEAVQSGYAPLREIGTITPGPAYSAALDKIVAAGQGASRSFPGIKGPDIGGIVEPLRQASFNSADAIDAISVLRGQADEAFSSGSSQAGRAYKSAAKALEDAIEQHLTDQGEGGASLLQSFRAARTQIAKSIDIGKALNEGTGQISATKIAQIGARSPGRLSGGLADISTFARAYPKVSREVTDIFPSISPLDTYGSAIAAGASRSALPLAIPLTRVALRNYLMSQSGQVRAIQKIASPDQSLGILNVLPQIGLSGLAAQ